jgi:hypothetical protein
MVKWRKRERNCRPWAVAVGARTVSVGVSRIDGRILHALDASVLLTELVVHVLERNQIGCRPCVRTIRPLPTSIHEDPVKPFHVKQKKAQKKAWYKGPATMHMALLSKSAMVFQAHAT